MTTPFVYEAPRGIGIAGLEAAVLDAFHQLRDAVANGRAAIVIVRDRDLLGHGDPADAALANGLLGLVRAFATEGLREHWVVNMLAIEEGAEDAARRGWVERLSDPQGVVGALVRVGPLHLGRVPV
ncbi:MAG: hypothetical protein JO262_18745 [Solirubrobacterales bacterium]|nr:hypothetical protein [Solirubrobacterales bacterium]MBV9944173.1 hypothetical protein [Solirubrobacterales bacterium]